MRPVALAGALGLLLANAFFVWAEFAFVAARRTKIETLAAGGNRRARLARRSLGELDLVLAGAQLGITMASLGLGYLAEPAVADLLAAPLEGLPEGVAGGVEVALALTIVVAAHMVLGEMVPKNLAIADAERSALWAAVPFRIYSTIFRPVTAVLNGLGNLLVRPFGIRPGTDHGGHTPDELAAMLELSAEEGAIDPFEKRLVSRILRLRGLDARAAMVPRPDVVAVPHTATPAEIGELVVDTGHSRLPVFRETLDDVAGFVHVKDLLAVPAEDWGRPIPGPLVRDALVVPESRSLLHALADMRTRRVHVAVVVDEHGGVEGVLTLEDILEELVGDIRDEYDLREGMWWRAGPGRVFADGRLRPDELEAAIGLDLPEGDYDTIGGLVMARLGHVPTAGEEVEHDGWVIRVRRMDGRRIDLLEILEPPDRPESSHDEDAP